MKERSQPSVASQTQCSATCSGVPAGRDSQVLAWRTGDELSCQEASTHASPADARLSSVGWAAEGRLLVSSWLRGAAPCNCVLHGKGISTKTFSTSWYSTSKLCSACVKASEDALEVTGKFDCSVLLSLNLVSWIQAAGERTELSNWNMCFHVLHQTVRLHSFAVLNNQCFCYCILHWILWNQNFSAEEPTWWVFFLDEL